MSVLFFSLRGVPDDEADDVRELLANNDVDFYETSAGSWGLSMPAIWLYQEEDLQRIKPLFDEYQQQRAISQRTQYLALKQQGKNVGFFQHNFKRPVRFVLYIAVIVLVLYVSVKLLFELGL